MDLETAQTTTTAKLPILKQGPVTTEEKAQKKNDVKARSMLLMTLPNEHLMTFNQYKDAKTLFAAIQTRFGGNEATKKTQKTLLKQMYENFSAPSTESLDSIFNRLQKIIVEQEVKGTASSSSSSQNMAFVSSPSSTNEVNTAYGVSTANTQASQPNGSQFVYEDLEQIYEDELEEMDLKWQLALLSMRTRSFFQKTSKKITINGSDTARYDKSKMECFNYHKMRLFARECRGSRNQDSRNRNQDSSRRTVNVEETSSKAMVAIDGADSEVHNDKTCSKTCLKSFKTLKTQLDDLRIEFNKSEFNLATYKRGLAYVEEQLVFYKKNEVIFCKQLVVLKRDISYKDSEISMLKSELEKLKQEKESNQVKIKKFDNASKILDKLIGSQITDKGRKGVWFVSYNVIPPPHTWLFSPSNLDLSYSSLEEFQQPEFEGYGPKTSKSVSEDISNEVRESPDAPLVEELVSDDKLEKKTVFPTVAKIEFVRPKQQEKPVRKPVKYAEMYRLTTITIKGKGWYLGIIIQGTKAVNTARPNSAVVNVVKTLACWVWRPTKLNCASITLKRHNYVDAPGRSKSGTCPISQTSRNLMEDMLPLGEEPKEGKLQMCDKKNSVLFTDTGCFVLSPDFNLADESQVLLKVPIKNNMCSVDMKNIIPKESLTCLVAEATLDESMLWYRRLGHVNFKTINKLVKENLVRGLLTKHFENDQTCVACLKGKQYKASCKSKIQNSITQPLFMLHMDLFGPTFVSSLMNKKYYVVVTNDYSRFTWVFFLASKDETSGILKIFITEIENLVDKKVKIIICDNGTEFKNRVMSEFWEKKGIKKEFSIARTPQQNGVAERRNRTLIEAARTMLADSKLPTTFWAEAANTACYVQNRVLVVKPHNKTLYELFRGTNSNDFVDSSLFDSSSKNASNDEPQPSSDAGKKDDEGVSKESRINDQERPKNSSQDINTVGPSINTASSNANTDHASLEATHADFFGDETEVDMSNITTTYPVPSTPNTIIHKDHSLDHMIGDVQSGEEPKRIAKALSDSAWVEAMQEELLQFKLQKVWVLVDLPKGKRAIGTKWVFRNMKDERGIVIQNKARLLAQGHTQEEGIDYDEVFAPVERIEEIRMFLAYASFMGFIVYQMDVKSAFLYGRIEEEVYMCQPLGFEDLDYPDKVYKVVKALYGLHQAPRAWYETLAKYLLNNGFHKGKIDQTLFIKKQKGDILLVQVYVDNIIFGSTKKELCTEFEKLMHDKFQMSSMRELTFFLGFQVKQKEDGIFISHDKYVAKILRKFSFSDVRTASTPMDTQKLLLKDSDGDDVDVHLYRYLKSQPKLGLWYPRDSSFDLVAYSDSDYAGASLDRKSTTGGCQFLGCKLISWQCKKQTVVATSSTKAEYVATASCCGQVLWIQNQMLDYAYNFMHTMINIDNNDLLTKAFDVGRF
ncbi:putative ribonuclease H-like domain-containing protein [Tanacetum coccineum]|uniref:Ribonuclease H-like domain-containing protein n=1 Tax=Tanacetum coccineum TaxID=301880 RepID=A0ABQ4Y5R9_9ASTR